jgi:hypothetical protein
METRFWKLGAVAAGMMAAIFSAVSSRAVEQAQLFPEYCDANTAALWLFDDPLDPAPHAPENVTPWYYTQTVTDASRNYYDLHLLHGGAIEEGHFGRALRVQKSEVGSGMQLATNFASEPRVYGVFSTADHEFVPGSPKEKESVANYFWNTVRPDQLVDGVNGRAWTIELWVRTAGQLHESTTLIDAGQGTGTTVRVELASAGQQLNVKIPAADVDVQGDVSQAKLADGDWHHLAIVRPANAAELVVFVDGKPTTSMKLGTASAMSQPAVSPGLVLRTFDKLDFDGPQNVEVVTNLKDDLASVPSAVKSLRLRGWIRAPFTGKVRFDTDADSGLHLDVDNRPLTSGWFGRAAIYRRSPRWGDIVMEKGKLYPVLVEMQLGEGDVQFANQRLYWSWDGSQKQPIPDSAWAHSDEDLRDAKDDAGGGFQPEPLMKTRFNLTLGSDRQGGHAFDGWLDEVRISKVARYTGDFTPATHSYNYGPHAPKESKPSGPPLLFTGGNPAGPIDLGSRRFLFFDDVLFERSSGVKFTVNQPSTPETLEPEMPGGDHSFFDMEGRVALFAPAGYEGREDFAYLWLSDDGVHFRLHDALTGVEGEKPTPIKTDVPAWGRMALDTNPDTPAWARFKYTAGVPTRGIYLLVSPDAIHWRRNETIMMQVATGGESHWYWDDQRGEYRYLLKWDHGPGGRQSVEATTRKCFEPWPLLVEGNSERDLATPLGYMPTRFPPDDVLGEVYRSRGVKYQWAPDAYVAFVWRFDRATQARQVELAVSRDGVRWKHFGDEWYMKAEFPYAGQQIHEVTSVDGMVRRGNEIWQYADYSTGRHDGSMPRWRVRLKQRLDGFVSLDAESGGGEFVSKPLTFSGDSLMLNAAVGAGGRIRVAVLGADGKPINGFTLDDCTPVTGDSTELAVSWKSKRMLSELVGQPVRLQFQLENAKLYAMQFE